MASHEYDPDDNFGHAFHAQSGIDDDDALEAVAWQFLHEYQKNWVCTLLDPTTDPLGKGFHIIQGMIAIGSGGLSGKGFMNGTQTFHVAEDDAQGLMEALDELAARWRLRIDWGLDDDAREAPDTTELLQAAFAQLREHHLSLWTLDTGEATLAGWITRERDEEAMHLVAGALGMPARPGVG